MACSRHFAQYLHESRHRHALNRIRGQKGRFVNLGDSEGSSPPTPSSSLPVSPSPRSPQMAVAAVSVNETSSAPNSVRSTRLTGPAPPTLVFSPNATFDGNATSSQCARRFGTLPSQATTALASASNGPTRAPVATHIYMQHQQFTPPLVARVFADELRLEDERGGEMAWPQSR